MCLDTISKEPLPKKTDKVMAFKAFKVFNGNVSSFHRLDPFKLGKWEKATGEDIHNDNYDYYPAGFHAAKTRRGCQKYIQEFRRIRTLILPVTLRKVTAHGSQNGAACWVAKEMFIDEGVAAVAIAKVMNTLARHGVS